jgi:hypothetical protein
VGAGAAAVREERHEVERIEDPPIVYAEALWALPELFSGTVLRKVARRIKRLSEYLAKG